MDIVLWGQNKEKPALIIKYIENILEENLVKKLMRKPQRGKVIAKVKLDILMNEKSELVFRVDLQTRKDSSKDKVEKKW